jgi:hypothetical protein
MLILQIVSLEKMMQIKTIEVIDNLKKMICRELQSVTEE